MHSQYNQANPFWLIINNKLPAKKVKETDHSLAFFDINPQDKYHILIIPKKAYIDFFDFMNKASDEEKLDWLNLINQMQKEFSVSGGKIVINFGSFQEVHHLHAHFIAK